MTPAARLQSTIDILAALDATSRPADRVIREWFRARRYAGSKDRAAIAERVFDIFRHRAHYAWRMRSETPRALAIASVLAEEGDVDRVFDGSNYGASRLDDAERHAIAQPPKDAPPNWVKGEYPLWLEKELERSLGDALLEEMQAMQQRAPVDLRVNTLKASRDEVRALLRKDGFAAEPTRHSPWGLRLVPREGLARLGKHSAFERGLFEFQDEGSQIVALLVDAKPNMRLLDLAAGAGGKALALAAAMRNEGEILAFDDIADRLKPLGERAARAGATAITIADKRGGPLWRNGRFDTVLLDAPCSGTGTWRRQPELRWRLTPDSLGRVRETQAWLLADAARHTRHGGRIVYATCSLLRCENEDQVSVFLETHPQFSILAAESLWREAIGTPTPPGMGRFFRATPAATGTDGFFAAILVRKDGT